MNIIDLYSPSYPDMKGWITNQLILERPHAEIVADFIERYPIVQKTHEQSPPEELKELILSVIKNMMRSKVGDYIRQQRKSNQEEDQKTIADQSYRDKKRQEIWDAMLVIDQKFDNEQISREEQIRLKGKLSILKSLRQELDAYERSENRQSSNGNRSFLNLPSMEEFTPAEEFPSHAGEAPPKKRPPTQTKKEPEPSEPEWYEIDDAEHLTV